MRRKRLRGIGPRAVEGPGFRSRTPRGGRGPSPVASGLRVNPRCDLTLARVRPDPGQGAGPAPSEGRDGGRGLEHCPCVRAAPGRLGRRPGRRCPPSGGAVPRGAATAQIVELCHGGGGTTQRSCGR